MTTNFLPIGKRLYRVHKCITSELHQSLKTGWLSLKSWEIMGKCYRLARMRSVRACTSAFARSTSTPPHAPPHAPLR